VRRTIARMLLAVHEQLAAAEDGGLYFESVAKRLRDEIDFYERALDEVDPQGMCWDDL